MSARVQKIDIPLTEEQKQWEIVDHLNDYEGTKLGMWFFLFTELILFTGLFLLYFVYLQTYHKDFVFGSSKLDLFFGTLNTVILLTSSLTMALSIALIRQGRKKLSIFCLLITIGVAATFLINKYLEWSVKFEHHIYPGSPYLAEHYGVEYPGIQMFYGLYFFMTGLHGIHVTVGLVLLSVMLFFILTDRINPKRFVALENSGLYWHLVDLIWIYLFPLFYLIK